MRPPWSRNRLSVFVVNKEFPTPPPPPHPPDFLFAQYGNWAGFDKTEMTARSVRNFLPPYRKILLREMAIRELSMIYVFFGR